VAVEFAILGFVTSWSCRQRQLAESLVTTGTLFEVPVPDETQSINRSARIHWASRSLTIESPLPQQVVRDEVVAYNRINILVLVQVLRSLT
jgi:hypothetical protein